MPVVDTNLFVGPCPFREVPSEVDDLLVLRERAGLDLAVATGFRSLLYYDPVAGLDGDLAQYEALSAWLFFYATVNPTFPQVEELVKRASEDARIVGLRLFPTLHHYALASEQALQVAYLAADNGLPVNVAARVFDGRVAPRYVNQGTINRADLTTFLDQSKETTVILSMFFFNELQPLKVDWDALPNVYLDLGCSKPSAASLDELTSWFPTDRVLFGTAAPFYYWGGSRLGLEGARLTEDQRLGILGGNAMEVFPWG